MPANATVTLGFWWYTYNYPGGNYDSDTSRHWIEFRYNSGGSRGPTFQFRTDGKVDACVGNSNVVATTTTSVMQQRTAHYVEAKVFISQTVGTMELWVDGTKVIDADTLDTQINASFGTIDQIGIDGLQGGTSGSNYHYFDDVYVATGAFTPLGQVVVETLLPDGNGNYSDFAGSDGNSTDNYLLVDENPHDSDTTYVESSTDTDRESYTFDNVPADTNAIIGVEATVVARNTGAADNIQLSTRISATDYDGATQSVPASYGIVEEVWLTSPATATDWTVSELNGAEFGFENVT